MKSLSTKLAVLLCACAVVALASFAAAQNGMAEGDKSEMLAKLEKMSAELQLTPTQKEQLRPILMQEGMQMKELKANTSLPPMQKAMKMRQIGNNCDAKVKPILNPQQYQKWEQMRVQERKQMMEKMETQ